MKYYTELDNQTNEEVKTHTVNKTIYKECFCVICLEENTNNVVYLPCGHSIVCENCHKSSQCTKCYICRGIVSKVIH